MSPVVKDPASLEETSTLEAGCQVLLLPSRESGRNNVCGKEKLLGDYL